jgi:LPXTG-motif cell wall-anchored protein
MENLEYLYSISSIIFILAGICVLIASAILFSKKRTISTTLILIGSISSLMFNIGNRLINLIFKGYDMDSIIQINAVLVILSGIAYSLFCIGLLLFVVNDFNKKEPKNKFLD